MAKDLCDYCAKHCKSRNWIVLPGYGEDNSPNYPVRIRDDSGMISCQIYVPNKVSTYEIRTRLYCPICFRIETISKHFRITELDVDKDQVDNIFDRNISKHIERVDMLFKQPKWCDANHYKVKYCILFPLKGNIVIYKFEPTKKKNSDGRIIHKRVLQVVIK